MHRICACLLLLGLASPARADCEVRGVTSLSRLRLRVEGQRIRTLSVTDLPVGIRPGRGTRYREVRVLAPIAFGVRSDADIPWTVPRPAAVAGGMLWLTPHIEIEDVREREEHEGLVVRAQVDVGVWIDRLRLPCEAIAVGHGEGGDATPGWGLQGGPRWAPAHSYLWVRSSPEEDDAPTLRIEAPRGLRAPLIEIERRDDGWVRVVARWPSGAALRGWVRRQHLRAARETDAERPPYVRAIRQTPAGLCRRRDPAADEYVGPARISVGAIIRFARDGEAWGTISEPAIFTVSWREGDEWVRVVHAPGLRGDGWCPEILSHAWVARRAVTLTGEGNLAGSVPGALLGLE